MLRIVAKHQGEYVITQQVTFHAVLSMTDNIILNYYSPVL